MNQPLAALALVILVGVSLVAYSFGYTAGKAAGLDEGREKGMKAGKKEGSIRAFAVGYDRGKREDQRPSPEDGPAKTSWSNLFLLVVITVVVLTFVAAFVNRR